MLNKLRSARATIRAVTDVAFIVERYYAVVADRDGSADALRALLHPDVRIVEHPNAINPQGTVRDRDAAVAGYLAGQQLLTEQTFDVHEISPAVAASPSARPGRGPSPVTFAGSPPGRR